MSRSGPGVIRTVAVVAVSFFLAEEARAAATCARSFSANVVAMDQPLVFNRLGAQNVNGMVYALARDVVNVDTGLPLTAGGAAVPGRVALRADKRPRPLVLRLAAGDCISVTLVNLLAPAANPNNAVILALQINDQVAERFVGFHAAGMQPVNPAPGLPDDSSSVGRNPSSLVPVGGSATYSLYAEAEGAFLVTSPAASFGGEGSQGNASGGLFGAVNVEPRGARFYRSQLTEEEQRLATVGTAATGQPILDYDAVYPATNADGTPSVWAAEGKAGLPIVRMTTAPNGGEIVHSDLNAIIVGPSADGTFPSSTYPLESVGKVNPVMPKRLEAFREFTVIFHDEVATAQAFPGFFDDPVFRYTLHGVRDSFMINYGSGGIGTEILANRLNVGPMHDCLDCAYEEFFLASSAVGDPAMVVDAPANLGLELLAPGQAPTPGATGPKASQAFYPDDPANVHHAYVGDHVKFRNLHVGKEHHVFHLHNHQWLFNPNDDNSNYIDAQGIGPGSGYTYEINWGAGNRNKTAGDAIFHCHFYPHFAQGMWELFRVHDVLETGTALAASGGAFHATPFALQSGLPAAGARALPDGEIVAGTPIPAVVPVPGRPMAPMPGRATVAPNAATTTASDLHGDPAVAGTVVSVGSLAVVDRADLGADGLLKNPGYPFWIAGIEETVGQRPPTPPLDMITEAQAQALGTGSNPLFAGRAAELVAAAGGHDGGLPRHALAGYSSAGTAAITVSRLDMSKVMTSAKPVYFPEAGTDVEQAAMRTHARRLTPSTALLLTKTAGAVDTRPGDFVLNGLPPMPSAPYQEPCIDDVGARVVTGSTPRFYDGNGGTSITGQIQYGATNPRVYKGAAIQIDAVFNKVGWHFPQERITALWDDVLPTISKARPPEPFTIRFNTYDCAKYLHTNLVPEAYELDDYQVRTPTDIIGQHIHLPKWDLTTTDGSANGWNYEDGTLAPGAVRERIEAINHWNAAAPVPVPTLDGRTELTPQPHPYFGSGPNGAWLGARTTIQRWFFDPIVNVAGQDRGLGIIFTHDHYGPSTHQQIGLYASVLTEPAGSTWVHNETGVPLNTRHDGGPTTWQAVIRAGPNGADSFREFWFQTSDFQHAYEPGVYVGAGPDGQPSPTAFPVTADTFRYAVNPGARVQTAPVLPDLVTWSPVCPGGLPRPCPEAISAADPGMFVINYRNEPVGLRVYDPNRIGPDGKPGAQAIGLAGDLANAFESRNDRKIAALNSVSGLAPYAPLTNDVSAGDPFTPILRAVAGDNVRIRVQIGGQEEEHSTTIHGVKWLQAGSSFGSAPNSGWRNTQSAGISEQFTFATPIAPFVNSPTNLADYLYSTNPSQDGYWTGAWGILRTYDRNRKDLVALPNNPAGRIANARDFNVNNAGLCPKVAPVRAFDVTAVAANAVLPPVAGVAIVPGDASATMHVGAPLDPLGGTLVANPRATPLSNGEMGPLHDPTALLYVHTDDLEPKDPADPGCLKTNPVTGTTTVDPKLATCPVRLKAGVSTEPIVLRAAAGDCLEVTLRNRLALDVDGNGFFDDNADLGNYTPLITIVARDRLGPAGVTTFNNNLIRPSSYVGLRPQLVAYDVTKANGTNVGRNPRTTTPPGGFSSYRWYAGDIRLEGNQLIATPIEFGGATLAATDPVKQGQKSLGGAIVVLPPGRIATEDAGKHSSASVGVDANGDGRITGPEVQFRDFVAMIQKSQSQRYASGAPVENIGAEPPDVITEDTQDAGQISLNNASEPLWFRFGSAPNVPLGNVPGGLGAIANARDAHSNALVGGDPVTPVFTALPGQPFRLHLTEPHGAFRGSVMALHGHVWQRDPYVCPGQADLGLPGRCAPNDVGSRALGHNPQGLAIGGQEGMHGTSHFEIVIPSAGGANAVPGDYLLRDQAGFGNLAGLWGIVRVDPAAGQP